jgi:hypothetical protein
MGPSGVMATTALSPWPFGPISAAKKSLRGSCGRHYIGSTKDFDRRLDEHRRGKVHSTRRFGQPLEVVVTKQVTDFGVGSGFESQSNQNAFQGSAFPGKLLSELLSEQSRFTNSRARQVSANGVKKVKKALFGDTFRANFRKVFIERQLHAGATNSFRSR